ncbi:MAG TPA: hypothetical protein VIF62_37505 [Labilithrix sp.]
MKRALAAFVAAAIAVACSSSSGDTRVASTNGVNDVLEACQIRLAWTNASTSACTNCLGLAIAPACDCDRDKSYDAVCNGQQSAKAAEPTCMDADACVSTCKTDCNCIDHCYDGKDACRPKAAALAGCLADICDPQCK